MFLPGRRSSGNEVNIANQGNVFKIDGHTVLHTIILESSKCEGEEIVSNGFEVNRSNRTVGH